MVLRRRTCSHQPKTPGAVTITGTYSSSYVTLKRSFVRVLSVPQSPAVWIFNVCEIWEDMMAFRTGMIVGTTLRCDKLLVRCD